MNKTYKIDEKGRIVIPLIVKKRSKEVVMWHWVYDPMHPEDYEEFRMIEKSGYYEDYPEDYPEEYF